MALRTATGSPDWASLFDAYRQRINRELAKLFQHQPDSLYEPARYILQGKGKRIRPILALLGAEAISGKSEPALPVALAVEVLHNFTLIHDDIMDKAELRHGRLTVHKKWDTDTAILTGDVMHAVAYSLLLRTRSAHLPKILRIFTDAVAVICEGQAYDKEFEHRSDVTLDEYLMMIAKKTGRLISVSLELGGLAANATAAQAKALRHFGELIGQAFQVQDDLLDIMAGDKSGKVEGGDVMEGKKTFLLLKALELAKGKDKMLLQHIIAHKGIERERVSEVKAVYERCGVLNEARKLIETDFQKALKIAAKLPHQEGREKLMQFARCVMHRDF
ncbi:MAG: polyprenyl synthetase family protein [Chloroherpetonaceae bacterium]|nr:polyprenyl synthetase family protein [Chloroherpetonaceae bacterium]MCS7210106.1 polyprenyl synthetase family protein [Chloroherpetonaceae bacterium]MDW8020572.1 polyprenyl synthetase family protein [Chloroherpetonaceae bacterium]